MDEGTTGERRSRRHERLSEEERKAQEERWKAIMAQMAAEGEEEEHEGVEEVRFATIILDLAVYSSRTLNLITTVKRSSEKRRTNSSAKRTIFQLPDRALSLRTLRRSSSPTPKSLMMRKDARNMSLSRET